MTEVEELFAIVRDISRFGGSITDRTRVWHDLRLSGDDAYEMLEAIKKRFGTSFQGMNFNRYFPGETEGLFFMWAERFGMKTKFSPLPLGHRIAVVRARKWYEMP